MNEKTRRLLQEVLQRMEELHDSSDTEVAHSLADDLLVETIRILGGYDELQEIIHAYESLLKWYA